MIRRWLTLVSLVLTISMSGALPVIQAQSPGAPGSSGSKDSAPDIAGDWTGDWGPFNPATGTGMVKGLCKSLTCKVVNKDGVWQATFEGDCGRPYKYNIKMEGRQVGKAVLFKGTVDLGEKDGGVFDWIGKANEKEFVGFFTSANYTGVFTLSRPKQ